LMGSSDICHGVWDGDFLRAASFKIRWRMKVPAASAAGVECSKERMSGLTIAWQMGLPRWSGCSGKPSYRRYPSPLNVVSVSSWVASSLGSVPECGPKSFSLITLEFPGSCVPDGAL
jgi:hypothetical protein